MSANASRCGHCARQPGTEQQLLSCTGCLSVYYCSQACQAAAWRAGHRLACKRMAQEAMQALITRTGGCLLMTNLATQAVPGLSAKTPIEQATALSWTLRDEAVWVQWHIRLLTSRALIELTAHHDLEARRRLASMITRALTTLEWPRPTSSAQEWLDYFHLALSLIQLGGREEAIPIMARQLEGIENRAPPGIAALSLLRLSKALVDKAYAEAEKMGRFVKAANVFPQQTIAALDRAAALLPALDGDVGFQELCRLMSVLHNCQAKGIAVPFARRRVELSPPAMKGDSLGSLVQFLRAAYRLREADDAAKEGLALANLSPADRQMLLECRAFVLRSMGKLAEALALMQEALTIIVDSDEAPGDEGRRYTLIIADLLDRLGRRDLSADFDATLEAVVAGDAQVVKAGGGLFTKFWQSQDPNTREPAFTLAVATRADVWTGCIYARRNEYMGPFYRVAREWADRGMYVFYHPLRWLYDQMPADMEWENLIEGPQLPRKIKELLIETLRHKGTPEALREAQVVADEVARMKEAEEANWRVALEETRAAIAAEAIVRREGGGRGVERGGGGGERGAGGGSKKKKKKKGKKKRGQSRSVGSEDWQDEILDCVLETLDLQDKGGSEAVAAEGGGAAEAHQEEEVQEEEPEECSICIEPLAREDEERGDGHVRTLDCGHAFHEHCMDLWFGKCAEKGIEPTCPYCRHALQ